MKQFVVVAMASAFALQVNAQSVQEGEKMIDYGRYESAKKALEPLAANNAEANYYLGIAELGLENIPAARTVFAKYPDDFYNQAGMARVLFAEGQKDQAGKMLNAVVDKAKRKDWERYKVAADAITQTKGGNITDAVTWYEKALSIKENDARLLIALGEAYEKVQGGGGQAMDKYEKAVAAGTHNSLAYAKIGSLWYAAHKYDLALKSYEQAKDADPSNPLPYRDLAYAYYRAGNYENALKNIDEYINRSDKSIDDQITRADLLFYAKKYPEAKAAMQTLIGQGVEKPYMYRIIAYSAYETQDYATALQNMHIFYGKQEQEKIINDDYVYSGKIMSAMAMVDSNQSAQYNDSADYYFNLAVANDTTSDKSDLYRQIAEGFKDNKEYKKAGNWYGKIITENADAAALDYFYWGFWTFYGQDYPEAARAFKAMRAKYPLEGSGILWDAKVAAAIDNEAKTGAAVPIYKEWFAFEHEGYEKKDADMMAAWQYIAWYYYNTDNQSEAMVYVNKILEKEPANEFANQVKDYYAKLKASK